jgi:hypothetical protein
MFDRRRMRFFLAIVLGAGEEPELRPVLAAHARELSQRVAAAFGREADDPSALAFVDLLRGLGLRLLLEPENTPARGEIDLEALAASLGLRRSAPSEA